MTRLLLCTLFIAGCAPNNDWPGAPRPEILRDVEGYAISSCLTRQSFPYLRDQGDAWAAVIVQRMKGSLDAMTEVADAVAQETAKGEMAVIRSESGLAQDKSLPVLYCGEIIVNPAVRAAIGKAVNKLKPAYAA